MKKEILGLVGPFTASLIGYVCSVVFLAAYLTTKDANYIPVAFVILTVAPVPVLVSLLDMLEGESK
jgi:hypothetical protein